MVKWLAMWTGSIAAFVVFAVITQLMIVDWPGESGDTGIMMAYTNNLPLSGIHFFVDTTHNPNTFLFNAVVDVENRQDNALLFLVLPYSGTLKDESGWLWKPFEDSTLLVKKFDCSSQKPCSFADSNQFFNFELDNQIDQKQSSHHSVRLWFYESSPLLDTEIAKLVRQFNPDRIPYNVGFEELENAKATIRLDKTSDSFGITPEAPIVPGTDGKVFQLDWSIQSGILHQVDYQIPAERNLETQMLNYTALFGIGLGITNLAIYGAEQRSKRLKKLRTKKSKSDQFAKDAIDDSYHFETSNDNKKENGDSK
ncbi:MAG: hypothetical protein ACE5R3_04205 [Nitrosopumilaceae archaeon]